MPRALTRIAVTGGVNRYGDPRYIPEGEVLETKNLYPLPYGAPGLMRRLGTRGAGAAYLHGLPNSDEAQPGHLILTDEFGTNAAVVYHTASNSHMGFSDHLGIVATISTSRNIARPVWLGNRLIYMGAHGANQGVYSDFEFDPVSGNVKFTNGLVSWAFAGAGNGVAVTLPRYAIVYRNRMAYLDDLASSTKPDRAGLLFLSDPNQPFTVGDNAATSRGMRIGQQSDEWVVGGIEIQLSSIASPIESALLVLRRKAAYIIRGEPKLSTEQGDPFADLVTVSRVAVDVTAAAPNAILNVPGGTVWLGLDDVWFMPYSSTPYRVGTKIRPVITGAGLNLINSQMTFDGRFLRVSLWDPAWGGYAQWLLDLEFGPPGSATEARWFGPIEYNFYGRASARTYKASPVLTTWVRDSTNQQHAYTLMSMGTDLVTTHTQLRPIRLDHDTGDSIDSSSSSDVLETDSGASGALIEVRLRTKHYGADTPNYRRLFEKVHLEASVKKDTSLTTRIYPDMRSDVSHDSPPMPVSGTAGGVNHLAMQRPDALDTPLKYVQVEISDILDPADFSHDDLTLSAVELVFTPLSEEP